MNQKFFKENEEEDKIENEKKRMESTKMNVVMAAEWAEKTL